MRHYLFPFLFFSLTASAAGPRNCDPVDLSGELGEVRSQDHVADWCYAFAASDLISFYLKQKVSAADIALHEIKGVRELEDILETNGGSMVGSVERTLMRGVCLETDLPSHPLMLQTHLTHDPDGFWKYVDASCKKRISIATPRVEKADLKKKALIRKIDQVLDEKNIVEIRIDAGIFTTTEVGRRKINHDVLVVGRKWNEEKGICEYKIRNSWGKDCSPYRDSIVCEEGHLWLTDEEIMRTAIHLIYLAPR